MPTILMIGEILREAGICDQVLEARDRIEGLELIDAHDPDLILCDITMPRLGGEKLLALVTARAPRRAPFLVLTARRDQALCTELLRRGARDVIAKSVDPSEITARVALHLELARLERDLLERNRISATLSLGGAGRGPGCASPGAVLAAADAAL